MIQDFVNETDDLCGVSFEKTNTDGDRIMVRPMLRLRFVSPSHYVCFKRVICGDKERQVEHPDAWLVLTSEQLRSADLNFVIALRPRTTLETT